MAEPLDLNQFSVSGAKPLDKSTKSNAEADWKTLLATDMNKDAEQSNVDDEDLEYTSAISYVNDLIERLSDGKAKDSASVAPSKESKPDKPAAAVPFTPSPKSSAPDTVPTEMDEAANPDVTQSLEDATCLLDEIKITSESDFVADVTEFGEQQSIDRAPDFMSIEDDFTSQNGYAYRRSLLHSLREAAHLATNTSLDLNECGKYAHRAYCAGFFGCAVSIFSMIFVLMSPQTDTFGFAASVVTFSLALGLGLVFAISFRSYAKKVEQLRFNRNATVMPALPVGESNEVLSVVPRT